MLSDAKISAHFIKRACRMFSEPRNRRDLARELRRVRVESGRRAAFLLLATYSAIALQK